MATMGVIVTEMILCLLVALLIGALFGYLYGRSSTRERYENKIDALQELCESKRKESEAIKERFGKLEIENAKLEEEAQRCEELLVECREKEEEMLRQIDVIVQENESLQQKLSYVTEKEEDEGERTSLLEEIGTIKKLLEEHSAQISSEVREEIVEELSKAEKMVREGAKKGKIGLTLQSLFGKIKPS